MRTTAIPVTLFLLVSASTRADEWSPAPGPLLSRFAADVRPEAPLPEYPRPQMVRSEWLNLNGLWELAIASDEETTGSPPADSAYTETILVPFPVESALSGVGRRASRLWYRRTFDVPPAWSGQRVILHFGAVDWETTVRVNGRKVGSHRGGYDAFSFDITGALKERGPQEVVVSVWDPTDAGTQPRGKQVRQPRGIWYTPTTGIWQTVWLEPVPEASIESLVLVPDLERSVIRVDPKVRGAGEDHSVSVTAYDGARPVASAGGRAGMPLELSIPDPKPWSPSSPFLYDLVVRLSDGEEKADEVKSYFGMRDVSIGKDDRGITRILLNGKPLFQLGLLDQGFWPGGLYTAPTDEALRYDIEVTRALGYNMARKHVKVEPARWYTWCDRLGLLVWQDMPSGDASSRRGEAEIERSEASAEQFELELRRLVEGFRNHPSIVMWVVFNEGWGQYETARLTEWVKKLDPSRLVDCASGWNDVGAGDVHDIHAYPGPASPRPEERRAAVLGEFGGLGLPLEGHTWQDEKNWGYRSFDSLEELNDAYVRLLSRLRPLTGDPGLSAAVYTQTTDVEIEVNGVMTYDRKVVKLDRERAQRAHRGLYLPPPRIEVLVPTSRETAQDWRYTTEEPEDGWMRPGFDDGSWKKGPAGFGTEGTPGSVVRTEWSGERIWIRRTFEVPAAVAELRSEDDLHLRIHHDEDARVYLNGTLALSVDGYTTGYADYPLNREGREALRPGKNLIAIHCRQTGGGQYIDAGLVAVRESVEPAAELER